MCLNPTKYQEYPLDTSPETLTRHTAHILRQYNNTTLCQKALRNHLNILMSMQPYSQVGSNSHMSQDRVKFEHLFFPSTGESRVK